MEAYRSLSKVWLDVEEKEEKNHLGREMSHANKKKKRSKVMCVGWYFK